MIVHCALISLDVDHVNIFIACLHEHLIVYISSSVFLLIQNYNAILFTLQIDLTTRATRKRKYSEIFTDILAAQQPSPYAHAYQSFHIGFNHHSSVISPECELLVDTHPDYLEARLACIISHLTSHAPTCSNYFTRASQRCYSLKMTCDVHVTDARSCFHCKLGIASKLCKCNRTDAYITFH